MTSTDAPSTLLTPTAVPMSLASKSHRTRSTYFRVLRQQPLIYFNLCLYETGYILTKLGSIFGERGDGYTVETHSTLNLVLFRSYTATIAKCTHKISHFAKMKWSTHGNSERILMYKEQRKKVINDGKRRRGRGASAVVYLNFYDFPYLIHCATDKFLVAAPNSCMLLLAFAKFNILRELWREG